MSSAPGQQPQNYCEMTDQQLASIGMPRLIALVRRLDHEKLLIMRDSADKTRIANGQVAQALNEVRTGKEERARLTEELKETQQLACQLHEDRQRSDRLATEWQQFGKYMAGVFRSELTAYQTKLGALEERQSHLLRDNTELKQICVYLDRMRSDSAPKSVKRHSASEDLLQKHLAAPAGIEDTFGYIHTLEGRITKLEAEHKNPTVSDTVANALKLLEVRDQFSPDPATVQSPSLNDDEKLILKQMCNVVWKKLEAADSTSSSLTSPSST